jgi:hypothetical protein
VASSNKTSNRNGSGGKQAASRARSANQLGSEHLEGREPSPDPDVFVDISKCKVEEVYVDVEHLEAHLALRAKLANLLQVVAGVHVSVGKVEVDIKGVEAEARLKVRLENLYDILDRALTTLDRNPEILEGLVQTLDDTVGDIGQLGEKALGPGGAATQAVGGLTNAAGQALGPGGAVGQVAGDAGQALGGLGQTAGQALGQVGQGVGGAVGQVGQGVGQASGQLGQQTGETVQGLEQTAGTAQAESGNSPRTGSKSRSGGRPSVEASAAPRGQERLRRPLGAGTLAEGRRARDLRGAPKAQNLRPDRVAAGKREPARL